MKLHRHVLVAVAVAAVAVAGSVAACSGAPAPSATPRSGSASGRTAAAPAASAPSAAPPSSVAIAAAAPKTAGDLKKALLTLSDLPSGFTLLPDASAKNGPKATSTDPKCAPFVRITNATVTPGTTASAMVSFTAGRAGPVVGESLDTFGSASKAAAFAVAAKSAAAACHGVRLAVPGVGTSSMIVQVVNPPLYGKDPIAVRVTGIDGPLKNVELTMVSTDFGDTAVSLNFIAATRQDVEGATRLAFEKATKLLGDTGAAVS
ncbi:hypothetical protein BJ986_000058 [Phycicoccus badiiscoriae]|uniref:PknH-like extracellular domain-containing protein n=1 Tax=Pedococcus badiiscoriae TaxID=642776 RepID=A0A852WDV4_9MICO|nr:hypothetical protein [Pedococcus badiiscoriae]NYG05571.1 hypothetical protein [Pedococcus badiiscoriae]